MKYTKSGLKNTGRNCFVPYKGFTRDAWTDMTPEEEAELAVPIALRELAMMDERYDHAGAHAAFLNLIYRAGWKKDFAGSVGAMLAAANHNAFQAEAGDVKALRQIAFRRLYESPEMAWACLHVIFQTTDFRVPGDFAAVLDLARLPQMRQCPNLLDRALLGCSSLIECVAGLHEDAGWKVILSDHAEDALDALKFMEELHGASGLPEEVSEGIARLLEYHGPGTEAEVQRRFRMLLGLECSTEPKPTRRRIGKRRQAVVPSGV